MDDFESGYRVGTALAPLLVFIVLVIILVKFLRKPKRCIRCDSKLPKPTGFKFWTAEDCTNCTEEF